MNTPSTLKKVVLYIVVYGFFAISILAAVIWVYLGFPLLCIFLCVLFIFISQIGITVGYHRYFTHQSFETTRPVKIILAIMGSMTLQGSPFDWVSRHRTHHKYTDKERDPHSPLHGKFHAHAGFLFKEPDPDYKNISGLMKDPDLVFVNRHYLWWTLLSFLLPPAMAWFISHSLTEVLLGFLVGDVVRMCWVLNVTWGINSICHMKGSRPFETGDQSRNNWLFGWLAFGEGYHNTHHAYQWSARLGLNWYDADAGYWIIKLLEADNLVWGVRKPDQAQIEAKKRR